ncbi:17193_t:CDS:2 [Funneliformis caledonium]|uniref:17193_t:CDS:1 n=1 Tax=Funneliformis caledonium TaxID=1117310 RepID=A0A9N8W263_9GLOM|nr:17193_t:CDS:2 [Funneliformis caledonium]
MGLLVYEKVDIPTSTSVEKGLMKTMKKLFVMKRFNGQDFLDLTQDELERHGMKLGPANRLVKFAKG